jgi:hypothetical protein
MLGCSAASSGDDETSDDLVGEEWRGDPGVPISGDSEAGPGGKADGPGECPAGVVCVSSVPFTHTGTTAAGGSVLNGYGCDPDANEGGPEAVYRLDLDREGLVVASLSGLGAGVDVDVHILRQLQAGACIDRGDRDAAALLAAGRFWIVVDSFIDGSGISREGNYRLSLTITTARSHQSDGLDPEVLRAGLSAFARGWARGKTEELEYGIIDYTMPSIDPRFFVLDLRQADLLYAELVAHGSGSQDPNDPTRTGSVSNADGSHKSSVGMVRTAETYSGSNGYSLRLDGLEPGFNSNDRGRAIVVHGASYATQSFVDENGYLGRSWGCPAVDPAVHDELIDTLRGGRLLLKYFDSSSWLASSAYVGP